MIVIDACVAAKLFVAEADSEIAERVFEKADIIVAPDLIAVEVSNALYKAWRTEVIDAEYMSSAVSRLPTLFPCL